MRGTGAVRGELLMERQQILEQGILNLFRTGVLLGQQVPGAVEQRIHVAGVNEYSTDVARNPTTFAASLPCHGFS
jgi:hypothetical protein